MMGAGILFSLVLFFVVYAKNSTTRFELKNGEHALLVRSSPDGHLLLVSNRRIYFLFSAGGDGVSFSAVQSSDLVLLFRIQDDEQDAFAASGAAGIQLLTLSSAGEGKQDRYILVCDATASCALFEIDDRLQSLHLVKSNLADTVRRASNSSFYMLTDDLMRTILVQQAMMNSTPEHITLFVYTCDSTFGDLVSSHTVPYDRFLRVECAREYRPNRVNCEKASDLAPTALKIFNVIGGQYNPEDFTLLIQSYPLLSFSYQSVTFFLNLVLLGDGPNFRARRKRLALTRVCQTDELGLNLSSALTILETDTTLNFTADVYRAAAYFRPETGSLYVMFFLLDPSHLTGSPRSWSLVKYQLSEIATNTTALRRCPRDDRNISGLADSAFGTISGSSILLQSVDVGAEYFFDVPVDFIVVDDKTVFVAISSVGQSIEYRLVKVALGSALSPRTFIKSILWTRRLTTSKPYITFNMLGGILAASDNRIYAINGSSLVSFPLFCDLYETCDEVVHANEHEDPTGCVWCAQNWSYGASVKPSTSGKTCWRQVHDSLEACPRRPPEILVKPNTTVILVSVIPSVALVLAASAVGLVAYRQFLASKQKTIKNITDFVARERKEKTFTLNGIQIPYSQLPNYISNEVNNILFERLREGEFINEGHFGIVWRGTYDRNGDGTCLEKVAIKTLQPDASVYQLLLEGNIMQHFNHERVLRLLGVSFRKGIPLIVTPFMKNGSLHGYLRSDMNIINLRELIEFALQIADGVRYLHSKNVIHRDLATRNCMLDNERKIKVGDFGLCRDVHESGSYISKKTLGHMKWMAPESFAEERMIFTRKTDSWAYGVVLWELTTRGEEPYAKVYDPREHYEVEARVPEAGSTSELLKALKTGYRLAKNKHCPEMLYAVMRSCWRTNSKKRPDFDNLYRSKMAAVMSRCREEVPSETGLRLGVDYFVNATVPPPRAVLNVSDDDKDAQVHDGLCCGLGPRFLIGYNRFV